MASKEGTEPDEWEIEYTINWKSLNFTSASETGISTENLPEGLREYTRECIIDGLREEKEKGKENRPGRKVYVDLACAVSLLNLCKIQPEN